ncbi:hypothetical protein GCM10017562_55920 [Streptomyces roseofulvus]
MACPGAACHYLAELPGVSGVDPGPPLWHGYLFTTRSDWASHWVAVPFPGAPEGVRTQGSSMYSIRATRVDRRAAQLLGVRGS